MQFKYLYTALLVTWLSFGGYAQFILDVEAGINLAKVNNLEVSEYSTENRLGYYTMITPGYRFGDKMEIRAGVLFNSKGYKYDYNPQAPATVENANTYLEVMPVFAYTLFEKIKLGVGVSYGYLINMRVRVDKEDWDKIEFHDDDKRSDFGVLGELGVQWDRFWVGTRYIQGLNPSTNVHLTDQNGQPLGFATAKSRVIQFGIRYRVID